MCPHVVPLHDKDYELVYLREENKLFKKVSAAYEASFITMEDDKQKLKAANKNLQDEMDLLISQND